MQPNDRTRVNHMIDAGETVREITRGRSRSDLDTDVVLQLAVVRAIEIMGEAANHVSPIFKESHPSIPWQAIIGMRNRLVHAYFDVDQDVIWQTVTVEIPDVLAALRLAIDRS
jgi:uncharacterized protein with HEPN domain